MKTNQNSDSGPGSQDMAGCRHVGQRSAADVWMHSTIGSPGCSPRAETPGVTGIRAGYTVITRLPLDRDGGVQQIMYNSINHVGPGILHHHPTSTPRINKQWQWPHIQTLWILSLRRPWAPTRVPGVPRPALRRPRRAPYSVRRKGMI